MARKTSSLEPKPLPDIDCACATIRRAARVVTQLYAEELSPRLEATQFALLSILGARPGCNQVTIGRALAFDKTTLSRNLKLLKANGWIEVQPAEDLRDRGYRLTAAGKDVLHTAKPGWKRAQGRLRGSMTPAEWDVMWKGLRILTQAAQSARRRYD
ncbi:MAG: MarR family winged helix-turn-helix transcriptional regulator [Bryobacteraceae bacterium]